MAKALRRRKSAAWDERRDRRLSMVRRSTDLDARAASTPGPAWVGDPSSVESLSGGLANARPEAFQAAIASGGPSTSHLLWLSVRPMVLASCSSRMTSSATIVASPPIPMSSR